MRVLPLLPSAAILIFFSASMAFAENPTNYAEWDFDFQNTVVEQVDGSLDVLKITSEVKFRGEMDSGSVDIIAQITDPAGKTQTHFVEAHDMIIGESRKIMFTQQIKDEGEYKVDLSMVTTSVTYRNHVFDSEQISYIVDENGFEKRLESSGVDTTLETKYKITSDVEFYETIHVVFNLPESHSYEKIRVNNGDFQKEYDIETTEMYLDSKKGYDKFSVDLVKEQNLSPTDEHMKMMSSLKNQYGK